MSWLFSRALGEAFSADICSDGELCALWNGIPTQQVSWLLGRTTRRFQLSRSGMTYRLLTDDLGEELLMSYLAGFRAKTSAQPEKARESLGSAAVCGHTWRALSVRFCRDSSTWKTAQCLWDEDLLESSVILPRWGMTVGGECWERMTWVRPMSVSACGSWPTPTAHKTTQSGQIVNSDGSPWDGKSKPHSKTSGDGLATVVKRMTYPTPSTQGLNGGSNSRSAAQKRGMYPAPTCHMTKEGDYPSEATRNQPSLTHIARGGDQTQPTTLNPAWVEWLMGWPIGWTDLEPLEMDKYQQWLRQHGKS